MHSSAVLSSFAEPPTAGQLVVDSHHETEVHHPLSLEQWTCITRVKIFTVSEGIIVVVGDRNSHSMGLGDSYAFDQVASEVLSFAVTEAGRRDSITWIAQLPPLNPFSPEDRFFEVTFARFLDEEKYLTEKTRYGCLTRSSWHKISRDYLEALIGAAWGE